MHIWVNVYSMRPWRSSLRRLDNNYYFQSQFKVQQASSCCLLPLCLMQPYNLLCLIKRLCSSHLIQGSLWHQAGMASLWPPQLCNAQLISHLTWVWESLLKTEVLSKALLLGVFCHVRLATWSMNVFCLGMLSNGIFTGSQGPNFHNTLLGRFWLIIIDYRGWSSLCKKLMISIPT